MTPYNETLKGKIALVTGGDRGIGKAIALKLSDFDASVAITYRKREDEAKSVLNEIKNKGKDAIIIKADISNKNDIENMFKIIEQELGKVDILVNNAGVGFSSNFLDISYETWEKQIEINLNGNFYVTKLAVPNMVKNRWGRIIFISSIAGIYGAEFLSAYSAAKAGLIGLAKSLAIEMAKYNITVNVVAPGFVETKLGKSYFDWLSSLGYKDPLKYYLSSIPSGRLATEEEVASAVAFLSLPSSSGITGQVIVVDAGASLNSGYAAKF